MSLIIVGGEELGLAAQVLTDGGWAVYSALPTGQLDPAANVAVVRYPPVAGLLKDADARGLRYQLIHLGGDDGEEEGSYARAHARTDTSGLREIAEKLRTREHLLVKVVAFGFKNGIPADAQWVFDVRFLDNPYWDPELKPLDGSHEKVRRFVLAQPVAVEFLDSVDRLLKLALPRLRERGASEVVIAVGCTGGRHRSLVVADEIAARLVDDRIDVRRLDRELQDRGAEE